MKKEEAIRIITSCAIIYRDKLTNKNLLFIYGDPLKPETLETVFYSRQFHHLTGVKTNDISPIQFYKRCLDNRLSPRDFDFKNNGSTVMKLSVLNTLMHIETKANMIGDYDNSKTLLRTDKLAGSTHACIGFVKDTNDQNYHIPNTALKEDIRGIIEKQNRVLAVFKKDIKDSIYTNNTRLAKGIDLSDLKKKLNHTKLP